MHAALCWRRATLASGKIQPQRQSRYAAIKASAASQCLTTSRPVTSAARVQPRRRRHVTSQMAEVEAGYEVQLLPPLAFRKSFNNLRGERGGEDGSQELRIEDVALGCVWEQPSGCLCLSRQPWPSVQVATLLGMLQPELDRRVWLCRRRHHGQCRQRRARPASMNELVVGLSSARVQKPTPRSVFLFSFSTPPRDLYTTHQGHQENPQAAPRSDLHRPRLQLTRPGGAGPQAAGSESKVAQESGRPQLRCAIRHGQRHS